MRPARWYTMMIVVGFFYVYCTLVQYIRGQEIPKQTRHFESNYDPQYYDQGLSNISTINLDFQYHNYDRMTAFLRAMSATYPNLTALYSIGKSVQGRELWVMVVSSTPYDQIVGQPNIKYVANMHGNEAIGREMLLHLIEHLAKSYSTDGYVKWLLDNTRIHIMPSMNPDGFEVSKEGVCFGGDGRYNAQGQDLNRNFPDYFKSNSGRTQPETEAVKQWLNKIQFVLSANLHGGALVASYPFDNSPNHTQKLDSIVLSIINAKYPEDVRNVFQHANTAVPSLTPDDDVFKHLAMTYSFNHKTMHLGLPCAVGGLSFENGTTNGAVWYPLVGGMQDYNYVWQGCMDITIEMSCCKYPPASELPKFWREHKNALLQYMREVHRGVRGYVVDEQGHPIEGASLKVAGRDVGFQTTKYGEYWRILLPGRYNIEAFADGYLPQEATFTVVNDYPTQLNITLRLSQPSHYNKEIHQMQQRPYYESPSMFQERNDVQQPTYSNVYHQPTTSRQGVFSSLWSSVSKPFRTFANYFRGR